jgi:hydrogenase maturation factor
VVGDCARSGLPSTDSIEDSRVCLTLPWRVTELVDADRVLVTSAGRTLEVNRTLEPVLAVGDDVLVSCGFVVRRLMSGEAAEIAAMLASATDEAQPAPGQVR